MITLEDFSRIMNVAFSPQVTDGEIHTKIESHTRLGNVRPDTIMFIQILDQFYELCRHP